MSLKKSWTYSSKLNKLNQIVKTRYSWITKGSLRVKIIQYWLSKILWACKVWIMPQTLAILLHHLLPIPTLWAASWTSIAFTFLRCFSTRTDSTYIRWRIGKMKSCSFQRTQVFPSTSPKLTIEPLWYYNFISFPKILSNYYQ